MHMRLTKFPPVQQHYTTPQPYKSRIFPLLYLFTALHSSPQGTPTHAQPCGSSSCSLQSLSFSSSRIFPVRTKYLHGFLQDGEERKGSSLPPGRKIQDRVLKSNQVKADLILASQEQISSEIISMKFLDAGVPGSWAVCLLLSILSQPSPKC